MTLPIAVGSLSTTSELLSGATSRPEDGDDETPLLPVDLFQTIGFGVCPKKEWLVRVVVGYYDLMNLNTGSRECTMLEVKIQVSYLNFNLSKNYRETVHHLKLIDGARDDYPQFQPQVVVSEDRRNLAILLFHPHQQSSAVVMFQLRKPRSDLNPSLDGLPLPAYVQNSGGNVTNASCVYKKESPAVATHPHFVSAWGISAICSIPNVFPCVFLAVCNDGSLIWLDARSSKSIAIGSLNISQEEDLPISSLQVTAEGLERGQVLCVSSNSGHCLLAQWNVSSSTAVQQTKLNRNSTGGLRTRSFSEEEDVLAHNKGKSKQKKGRPHLHKRTSSTASQNSHTEDSLHSAFNINKLGFWQNNNKKSTTPKKSTPKKPTTPNFDWKNIKMKTSAALSSPTSKTSKTPEQIALEKEKEREEEEKALKEAKRRRNHMELKVLKELQNKALSGNWITHHTGRIGRRASLHRRRRSETARTKDPSLQNMKVEVLSVLKEKVVAAHFGSLPTVICVAYQATSRNPTVAQVFSTDDLGHFSPLISLWLNSEQVHEAHNLQATNSISSDEAWDTANSLTTKFGLDYCPSSDCFAISTAFGDQWIGCLWNWKVNALGLTLKNEANSSLWSRFYFSSHPQQGSSFCYLEASINQYQIGVRKQVVPTALLSPPNSYLPGGGEPCSLLLANDAISFPHAQEKDGSHELGWKLSTLPLGYINAYGPPKLAAIGRQLGSSMAVASKRGLCILESPRFRWRQFGTPSEESSFSVISMAWWEGSAGKEGNEDMLLTIIQSRSGRQYLSCWTPKKLGIAHQLLSMVGGDVSPKEEEDEIAWGIPLMKDIKATSLSLLAQPVSRKSPGIRKAVVFVSSANQEQSELRYAAFQLQLIKYPAPKSSSKKSSKISFGILAKRAITGSIKDGTRSIGPISSVYLAGASFRFDLLSSLANEEEPFVVTLGVTRTPGGLEVISLDHDNKAWMSPVVNAHEVSKTWLVDVIYGTDRGILIYVWGVELLNGELFCWSVPSLLSGSLQQEEFHLDSFLKETKIPRPKGLHPPTLVCKRTSRDSKKRFLLGVLAHVGTSADWTQQTSYGSQTDIFMGVVPRSTYGCGLRAGQGSKKVHRMASCEDAELFTTNVGLSELFGPSGFSMTPPAFVPSLYGMLLEAAHLRTEVAVMEESKMEAASELLRYEGSRISIIEDHIQSRLQSSPNKDAVAMALQLLIMRTVEMLAHVDKKHAKEQSDASLVSLGLAMALFSEVVDAIRKCTTDLQFASLFLEVGRQIEPSCLVHLFPLPPPPSSIVKEGDSAMNRSKAKTVVDLFSLCVQEGSLSASASALPLLGSRVQSRNYCDLLMQRTIDAFIENTSYTTFQFDKTEEERRVIGDIFRFGIKLEDAASFEDKLKLEEEKEQEDKINDDDVVADDRSDDDDGLGAFTKEGVVVDDDDSGSDFSDSGDSGSDFSSGSDDFDIEGKVGQNGMCNIGRNGKIFNMFSDEKKKEEEDAIRRSAINFIGSSSELPSLDFLEISENTDQATAVNSFEDDLQSMGGIVGGTLVDLLCSPKTDRPWKAMASLARMLFQGSFDFSPDIFSKVASRIKPEDVDEIVPNDGLIRYPSGRLAEFLVSETGLCGNEINETDSHLIVDLVLLLLHRLEGTNRDVIKNQAFVQGGLVLVGLIAACNANREAELLADAKEDCFISDAYNIVSYDC